jgi:hypothetical protein
MKLPRLRLLPLLICLASIGGVPLSASAAPADGAVDPQTVLARRLVDEMRRLTGKLGWGTLPHGPLDTMARFDFLLGRREASAAYLAAQEEAVARIEDVEERLQCAAEPAEFAAAVDPSSGRRLIVRWEPLVLALPTKRPRIVCRLAGAYLQLGDYRRALELLGDCPPTDDFGMWSCSLMGMRLLRARQFAPLAELQEIVRGAAADPEDVDPVWNACIALEENRVTAPAMCGLPDEAAKLYAWCLATGKSEDRILCAVEPIVLGFMRLGRPEAARAFLHQHALNVSEYGHLLTISWALAGDFERAEAVLAEASPGEQWAVLPTLIHLAQLMHLPE